MDFANEVGGTRALLRGSAAAAGKVPLLTDEAKARMKARMHSAGEGAGASTPHWASVDNGKEL